MEEIQRRLSDIQKIEKQNFKAKQNRKFKRDRLKQQSSVFEENQILRESELKRPRKRRFKKQEHSVQNNLVVNLSSIELTASEEKILNEPNGFTRENCVIGHTRTEKWIDIACYSEQRAVCQLKDITVNEGKSVQLTCGVNNMQTSWTRSVNNTSVKLSEYTNVVSLTNLVFGNVKWSDQGNYECSFTNIDGLPETKITRLFVNTSTKMCKCRCDYRRKLEYWESTIQRNQTKRELYKELEHVIRQIQDELKVNKTKLSLTIRKLTSAKDDRKTSKTIGFCGAVFISVVVGLVVFIDIVMLKQHIEKIWKKSSSKR
ncbi:unnamed protein product [Mytilus coruscus]|uniref:Ig-like domain-containing protein n=1 Tax=Mytilus coruscus TaxID=42192 RepID=A0A6J7ZXE8_MYTCO|nr:unnamed protein product [Mytilus coruscus]